MSPHNQTEALLEELDNQAIGVPVPDGDAPVPTLECACDDHNGEPIREGEHAVVLLIRDADGEWTVEETFCSDCSVLDDYAERDEMTTAIVEGVVAPENEFGPSKTVYLNDAFLWELYEEGRA